MLMYNAWIISIQEWIWFYSLRNIISINHKNHTHVKKVGHTSEFPFGIYWWTLKNPKNQNFEKMKIKNAGDIIILHMSTRNHNYSCYSYWDKKWDKVFVILSHFLPFNPHPLPTTQQTKILKKWKKHLEMSSF